MPLSSLPAVGVDLGGTNTKAALVDAESGVLFSRSAPTRAELGPDVVLDDIAELVRALMLDAGIEAVQGIGVGAPGAIDWERTTITQPPNIPGWGKVNLRTALRERLELPELPVIVENDANVAGLGSAYFGAGKPHDSFIMVTLGTGVGGAIIYQNQIFRGATGAAGELGHMTIDYEGPMPRSGVAGAIEGYIGQRLLSRYARYRLIHEDTLLHGMLGDDLEGLTPLHLFQAAEKGDEGAIEVLAWAGHKLGCVLGSAVNLLDIRTIIVGGGVSGAGPLLLDATRRTLPRYVVPALRGNLLVIRETLGNEVGTLGAAQLILQPLAERDS